MPVRIRARLVARGGPGDAGDRLDERAGGHGRSSPSAGARAAAGSPRAAACGGGTSRCPATTSTSCSAARQLERQRRRRAASARRRAAGGRAARRRRRARPRPRAATRSADLHVGGRELDAPPSAAIWTPGERLDGAARRRAARGDCELRERTFHGKSRASRSTTWTALNVVGAVEMWTGVDRPQVRDVHLAR